VNCIVCVTSVPDTASVIKIGSDGKSIDETGLKWIVSPYDEFALEEALKLTESNGGEVTVVTFGPARAEAALRDCLARGAQKAVHIIGGDDSLGDSAVIAKTLAAVIKDREYDLILVGVKGVGTDNGQVGPMLAEKLGLPHVNGVNALEIGGDSLTAGRDIEGGRETLTSPLPALVGCTKGLNEPRYAALKGIMAAKRKPVEKIDEGSLGIDGATYAVRTLELPPEKSAGTIINGEDDAAGAAKQLVQLLRDEAKAI
jgi:electron transfer flavoprotein beta subunit